MLSYLINIIVIVVLTRAIYILRKKQFQRQINILFRLSADISARRFIYDNIIGLPAPVQRYLKYSMNDGQPYISYVRLQHDGFFKTSPKKDWMPIKGKQYFTIDKPGFIWIGKTALFTAYDKYINGKGSLLVKLLALVTIVNNKGHSADEAELLRWLAESVWFPTNFIPNKHLQWEPIDNNSALLLYRYNDLQLNYTVTFNDKGEITQFETKRYTDKGNIQTWVGKCSNYKTLNNIRIPTSIEAIWRLHDSDYCYAKFNIKHIEYNIPKSY